MRESSPSRDGEGAATILESDLLSCRARNFVVIEIACFLSTDGMRGH